MSVLDTERPKMHLQYTNMHVQNIWGGYVVVVLMINGSMEQKCQYLAGNTG